MVLVHELEERPAGSEPVGKARWFVLCVAVPSTSPGIPTTKPAQGSSESSRRIFKGPGIGALGAATIALLSVTATPTRRVPKSKAM